MSRIESKRFIHGRYIGSLIGLTEYLNEMILPYERIIHIQPIILDNHPGYSFIVERTNHDLSSKPSEQ